MTNKPTMNSVEINFYLCLQLLNINNKNSSEVKVFKMQILVNAFSLQKGDTLQVRYICRSITGEGKLKMYKHCSHRRKYSYHRSQARFLGRQKIVPPVDCTVLNRHGDARIKRKLWVSSAFRCMGELTSVVERYTGSIRVWFGNGFHLSR